MSYLYVRLCCSLDIRMIRLRVLPSCFRTFNNAFFQPNVYMYKRPMHPFFVGSHLTLKFSHFVT